MPHPLAPAPSGRAPPAGAQMRPGQTRPGPPRPGLGRLPAASPPVGGGPGRAAALGGVSASPSHSGRAPQATTLSRRPPLLRSSASPVSAVGAPLPAPRRPVNAGFTIPGRGLARRVTTRASAASPAPADPLARASAWLADARAWFKASPFSSRKFFPMILLFFFMSFNNTVLDSLANSLVITASGGGTQVIPFLTVYAVWPCSIIFLVAYSAATQRLARRHLFNLVLGTFLAFYAGFALLYPSHEAIHLGGMATEVLAWAPAGLAGAVGMVRNWLFTCFYCTAELWGDVVLSLLFWGLANETTHMDEAPILYPLFGIGANMGQTLSGRALGVFHRVTDGILSDTAQVQAMMAVVLGCGLTAMALHAHIVRSYPPEEEGDEPGAAAKAACAAETGEVALEAALSTTDPDPACALPPPDHPSLRQAFTFLARSPQIRCLAVMALAQGLSANLIEIAWKGQVHLLHPSPAAYSAVMGDVAMWTGIVTGSLMLLSPSLFRAWKWRGVAGATPKFMLVAGLPFFVGSALFAWAHPTAGAAAAPGAARWLGGLVAMGALLQVFAKGAKFSMFKPAEEMVYIGLDEQSRTKGKAAIDVVGAQTGKSAGSVLQQVLLVASAGSMATSLPFMAAAFFGILVAWTAAVDRLDRLHVCAFSGELADGTQRDLPPNGGGGGGGGSPPPPPSSPNGTTTSLLDRTTTTLNGLAGAANGAVLGSASSSSAAAAV